MNKFVKLEGLPCLSFAHAAKFNAYENFLPANKNYIEITYIQSGNLKYLIGDECFVARQNDLSCNLFLAPMKVLTPEFHEHHTVCFHIPFTVCQSHIAGSYHLPLLTHMAEYGGKSISLIDEIIRLSTIHSERKLSCSGLFLQLIDLINDCNSKRNSTRHSDYKYVEKAKKYIYQNLGRQIEQREVAAYLKITPEYLCSIFKKTEGISLIHFINRIKLGKIASLVQKENIKLCNAIKLFGYSDPNYVSRLYKKYFGKNITDRNN